MTAAEVLTEVATLVSGDRAAKHGDKRINHACIASVWNGILNARLLAGNHSELNGHDVANLMEGLKIARRYTGSFNPDDYVDGAGYAAVAAECASSARPGAIGEESTD